jgi:hypothetical protein
VIGNQQGGCGHQGSLEKVGSSYKAAEQFPRSPHGVPAVTGQAAELESVT